MADDIDLDGYFERIGYAGGCAPTLDTLNALHFAQATAIPFENLDVLAKRGVSLDPEAVRRKLVDDGRGGYCFEHNALFARALAALGFRVTGLAARVRWTAPVEAVTPQSHMLLRVDLPEGAYIADVGFGGLTLTASLRLEADVEQETPHELHRLVPHGDGFELQAKLGENWASIYRFSLEPQNAPDYEVANWFTSTHPQSIFVSNLLAARPDRDRRHALFNTDFSIRHRDGRVENRKLATVGELAQVLRETFRVALSDQDVEAALVPHFDRWQDGAPR